MDLSDLRTDYNADSLNESDVDPNPVDQLGLWLQQAQDAQLQDSNAMILTTATPEGKPSARVVLLRKLDTQGLVFFTSYDSRKGNELAHNAHVALVFFWPELHRQVRVEGTAERTDAAESDTYFAGRPRGSQVGAWASQQSQALPDRAELQAKVQEIEQRFANQDIPRPDNWGGYRIRPEAFEFWQGRPNRLHDRLRYRRGSSGEWIIERLAP